MSRARILKRSPAYQDLRRLALYPAEWIVWRALRLARRRQEIQAGLDSGTPADIRDVDEFLGKCAQEASAELRAKA
jgi:hypothetical protein